MPQHASWKVVSVSSGADLRLSSPRGVLRLGHSPSLLTQSTGRESLRVRFNCLHLHAWDSSDRHRHSNVSSFYWRSGAMNNTVVVLPSTCNLSNRALEGTRIADRAYKRGRDHLACEAGTKSQASYVPRYPRGRNPWSRQRLALRKPRSRPERTRTLFHRTYRTAVARGAWARRWAKILRSQSGRSAQERAQGRSSAARPVVCIYIVNTS